MNWTNKRVLVTGGCGFIGSHLVRSLVGVGAAVRVVDNLERGRIENLREAAGRIEFHRWDLLNWGFAREACRNCDVVFHLAGKVGGLGYYLAKPWEVLKSNIAIDANVLAAVVDQGVPHYFYASSGHVAVDSITYGWAKRTGEKAIVAAYEEGNPLRAAIARIYGAYGPGQDFDLDRGSAIPVFCHRAARYPEIPFKVIGDGSEIRSYCYVTDIVSGIMQSVESFHTAPQVMTFDLGSYLPHSIRDIAEEIAHISGKQIDIEYDLYKAPIVSQVPRGDRLPNWSPTVSLSEGLQTCYADVAARLEAACV